MPSPPADTAPPPPASTAAAAADRALIARLAVGDPAAFDALVEAHQSRVARLAHRLLGWSASADVEDVVQEVFLAALRHAGTLRGSASLATWLTTVTLNHCRSRRRRMLTWLRALARVSREPPRAVPQADDRAGGSDTAEQVRNAIRQLAPRDREVIVLHYLEHTPVAEMTALLGLTRSAVEVRLHRARARLRTLLASLGLSAGDVP